MFNPSDQTWPFEDLAPLPSRLPSPATITAGLTTAQADAASQGGATLVLAGTGTGKTRTLTAGVALRIADVLAGSSLPSWIGTFHGLDARQLRAEAR